MKKKKVIIWKSKTHWLGYFEDYPAYWTQGKTKKELKEYLRDLYKDLSSGEIPGIRKVEELEVARSGLS